MQHLVDFVWRFAPYLALAALLAAIVIAINTLGKRWERHDAWLTALDARVGNLDKDRKATWARHLQRPYADTAPAIAPPPLVPPPLPPRAPTLDASDWRDDEAVTEDLLSRQTGRYPDGKPPKGPNE